MVSTSDKISRRRANERYENKLSCLFIDGNYANDAASKILYMLLQDDPEWFWVVRADGQEGFVPAGFVYPLDAIQRQRKDAYPFIDFSLSEAHFRNHDHIPKCTDDYSPSPQQ